MPMVDVRMVRVLVREHLVAINMRMRPVTAPGKRMFVAVMLVVPVPVGVLERLVRVVMQVPLPHMEPHTQRHQGRGHPEQGPGMSGQTASEMMTPNKGATEK